MDDGKVNILIVDDRPERVMALEAVLEELHENIVLAYSGRDALRALLEQEFAVILLDVSMPGMDGFETAALIRQRESTRDLPIIFITAYGDELQVSRGYSLGAVDYIQAPVVPDILRTKVRVFVDLHRKNAQVMRQAAWLEQRAAQLHKLTAASLAINSALSLEQLAQVVTDTARDVLGAHMGFTTIVLEDDWKNARSSVSLSEKYAALPPAAREPQLSGVRALLCRLNKPMRMTRKEAREGTAWSGDPRSPSDGPPSGWLAAPLSSRDGRSMGLIEVSDRLAGDFNAEDEALLVQLAQMASIAIENTVYAEAREANRLKDEFLWTLSHELRTPLNAILGWTQILSRQQTLPRETRSAIEVIDRNARAQTKLISEMLDLSRITTGKLQLNVQPMVLGPVVRAAVDTVLPTAIEKRLALDCAIPDTPIHLAADADRLQQVVWNLLTNAVKFTPAGGHVRLSVEPRDHVVEIRVADDGAGITPTFLKHVFDRFRQADSSTTRAQRGLGIGLTIVRHLVELHGGSVTAESPGEGCGSTFTVCLPRAAEADVASAARAARHTRRELPSETNLDDVHVLLVDDEEDAREVMAALLARLKAKVSVAASACEALELLRTAAPDVLVSDIAMPGQDGFALIGAVRHLPPEDGGRIPAVALTAYARNEDRARAFAAGFQGHVAKPVDPEALAVIIRELIAAKTGGAASCEQRPSLRPAQQPGAAPQNEASRGSRATKECGT